MNRLYTLLTVMVAMLGAALFITAHESSAQGLTGCQNPQQVLGPVTLNGDSTTNSFTTTTSGFRVNYDGAGSEPAPNSTAEISIRGVAGFSETVDANADTSVFFNLPPGTYRVDVNLNPGPEVDPESKSYIVSVDQCRETTTPTTDVSASCQNPQQVLGPVTLNGDSTTNSFTTTTSGFRVNYDGAGSEPAPNSTAEISIRGVAGFSETVDANADTSVFFNLPPGTYRVDVNLNPGPEVDPESKSYIVSVDQCRETTPTPTGDIVTCQNAQEELRVGPRTGDISTTFTTIGDFFFVNYEVRFDEAAPSTASAEIRIIDEDTQRVVEFVPLSADAADSFIVAQGAGTYRLKVDVDPDDAANYTVIVDDCLRTTTGTTDTNVTQTPGTDTNVTQTPGTDTNVTQTPGTDTIVTQTPGTDTIVTQTPGTQDVVTTKPNDVIGDTFTVGKPLPNTGGLSFLGLVVALLTLLIIGATKVLLSVVRR